MATIDLQSIGTALTVLNESGISFEGKARKWENSKAGKICSVDFSIIVYFNLFIIFLLFNNFS